jgi:hypothetical protein
MSGRCGRRGDGGCYRQLLTTLNVTHAARSTKVTRTLECPTIRGLAGRSSYDFASPLFAERYNRFN